MNNFSTHKFLPILALFLLIFNLLCISKVEAFAIVGYRGSADWTWTYDFGNIDGVADGCEPSTYYFDSDNFNEWCYLRYSPSSTAYLTIVGETDTNYQVQFKDMKGEVGIPVDYYVWTGRDRMSTGTMTCFGSSTTNEVFNINKNFQEKNNYHFSGTLYNADGTVFYSTLPQFNAPSFGETQESINSLSGGYCLIFPGDVPISSSISFKLVRRIPDNHDKDSVVFSCELNNASKYLKSVNDSSGVLSEFWYEIPYSDMYNFEKGQEFSFQLWYVNPNDLLEVPQFVVLEGVIGSVSSSDKIQDSLNDLKVEFVQEQQKTQEAINNQTAAIEENTQTNKNIFEKIGDILNILNPFSENFFAYKLIELLLNALKSLFIPSDDFFNNWLADLNTYFGDRFGILYYPFEVVIDFLTKFISACDSMSSSSAVINIPEMKFMSVTLISAFSYDFNSLLANDTLKMIHNIYLVVVDVIFSLMLVNLAKNTFVEVFRRSF